jgi:hypothetical protein
MAFGYDAEDWEADLAREVFGAHVRKLVFYDADDPAEGFELAVAYDVGGRDIGRAGSSDPGWQIGDDGMTLGDIPVERGQTVKFFLDIEEPGCEGHESLAGEHMGESVLCDGSCA